MMGLDHQFQGIQIATQLQADGFPIVTYTHSPAMLAPPTRRFMELVIAGKLYHNANPILRWMAGNLVMKKAPGGDLIPDKQKSHEKIDGILGAIMALGVMQAAGDTADPNDVYEERGILVI
jgi:phage terminase large subunit-like protein